MHLIPIRYCFRMNFFNQIFLECLYVFFLSLLVFIIKLINNNIFLHIRYIFSIILLTNLGRFIYIRIIVDLFIVLNERFDIRSYASLST